MSLLKPVGWCWLVPVAWFGLSGCGGGGGSNRTAPPPANLAPTAEFTINVSDGPAPLTVVVDAGASRDPDGTVEGYLWDFAGQTGIGIRASHTFTDPGSYQITLEVTDNDGARGASSRSVTANPATGTRRLTGTVRVLSSTAVDADVNDRFTTPQSNNGFDAAQPLPSPVVLGGFANVPGAGPGTGNLFGSGDPGDFYEIDLNGGEVVTLNIAEQQADLDLRLWDENRNIVDSSTGLTQIESIEVNQPGRYFIEVFPFAGASNYVLFVGQDLTAAGARAIRLSDPIMPGELILRRVSNAARKPIAGLMRPQGRHSEPFAGRPLAERYVLTPAADKALNLPDGARVSASQRLRMHTLLRLKQVAAHPSVAWVEPNFRITAHVVPDDTFYPAQWHYEAIGLPQAWDVTTGSRDVVVAVVDSGVLLNHPDLAGKLTAGYDFISDPARARDGDGLDADPDDPGDLELGATSSFHGTHVAGTVAAASDNARGVSGAGWQTRIMPLRVLGRDGGTTYDVAQAMRYAAGLTNDSGRLPNRRADVINLSLGSTFSSLTTQETVDEIRAVGVIVVASAGNQSSTLPMYPAAYEGVVGVSATTITNDVAPYSNSGGFIDLAAPGGANTTDLNGDGIPDGVISTSGDDSGSNITYTYTTQAGTSMAAPHVSGVVALMKAVHPGLTPVEFDMALHNGELTDDLGAPGRDDQYGFGLLNAAKAVLAAQRLVNGGGTPPGPLLSASAGTLNFGALLNQLTVTLRNIGSGSLTILNTSADQPWVNIGPPGTNDGLGAYTIAIDRNALADGVYQATLEFVSDRNSVSVSVIMQVSSLNLTANAGLLYILVVDTEGNPTAPATAVQARDGEYPFTVNGVAPGQYRLFAGTDADDDALLCDAGESCGAYPTLDAPAVLSVNADQTGLDFESAFRLSLTGDAIQGAGLQEAADLPAGLPLPKLETQPADE